MSALPVYDITGPEQSGSIDDGVSCCTCSVEIWILTDQVAGQESTMRATHHCHSIRIKSSLIMQSAQHCPLDTKNDKQTNAILFFFNRHVICAYTHLNIFDVLTANISKQRLYAILTETSGAPVVHFNTQNVKILQSSFLIFFML